MKKLLLLTTLAAFNYVSAQSIEGVYAINTKNLKENAVASIADANAVDAAANSKALKHFAKNYRNASNAQWFELDHKESLCVFHEKGSLNRAYYRRNGAWVGTVRTYQEELLPEEIRTMVNDAYPCKAISFVQEVDINATDPIYFVQVQDQKTIKFLRIQDGEMELTKEFKKQ